MPPPSALTDLYRDAIEEDFHILAESKDGAMRLWELPDEKVAIEAKGKIVWENDHGFSRTLPLLLTT